MINKLKKIALMSCALATGCATMDASEVSQVAKPNSAPIASVTQFEQPLKCMDRAFADFGVSGVTIAVSAVPDYTGRVFVGSDIWLQTAITKMSQRSGAFVVTDYNPNQWAPEQGLWTLSNKQGFYIPAYYVRGAISGFANNVAENTGQVAAGSALYNGGAGIGTAYSTVSVDLTIGNLLQRTLISRAHAGNEIVLESKAKGAQVGGLLKKFGANLEINASRNDGVPQAVRALVELNAIEILGRLTGVPYWTCLGADSNDPQAMQIRRDIFSNMSNPERVVFVQRRLGRLGYYNGAINGQIDQALGEAVSAYSRDNGLPPATDDFALYQKLTEWRDGSTAPQRISAAPAQPAAPVEPPKEERKPSASCRSACRCAEGGDAAKSGRVG